MSGYQGKNFRQFHNKDRSGANRGGGGQPEIRSSDATAPFLNEISAINMERYIEASHQYSLSHHASIAPWLRGRIPVVMLEYEMPLHQQSIIGKLAKHHTLPDGSTSPVNLLVGQVRDLLIQQSIEENKRRNTMAKDTKTNSGGSSTDARSSPSGSLVSPLASSAKDSRTGIGGSSMDAGSNSRGSEHIKDVVTIVSEEEEALRAIFPENAKKSREMERSNLWKESATLLGKMMYYWPSKDIQVKMLAHKSLVEAFENNDVIRFLDELRSFSLAGSGNPETNREAAEEHLVSLVMKSGRALEYFKAFTEAVENIRVCKSSFTEFKVVDLFFRNIDQNLFPNWYVKFLTEDDPMYRFQKQKFADAKEHALKYYNAVIRVNDRSPAAGKDKSNSGDSKKQTPVKSITHLRTTLATGGANKGPISVDPVVLATLFKQATAQKKKRKPNGEENTTGDKDEPTEKKKRLDATKPEDKKICWKFRDTGKCEHGSECYFAHTK